MPTYEVSINGRVFEVDSPEPLTQEEAYAHAQTQYEGLRAQQRVLEAQGPSAEEIAKRPGLAAISGGVGRQGLEQAGADVGRGMSGFQRFKGGILGGAQEIVHGVDELLPGRPLSRATGVLASILREPQPEGSPEDARAALRGVASSGWEGQAGRLAGLIAPTVLMPANALTKAPGLAALAKNSPRLAQVIGTIATAGGTAAATTPGDAATRGEAAMWAGGMAGALPTATMIAGAARRGTTQAGRNLSRAEMVRAQLARSGQSEDDVLRALRGPYEGSRVGVQPTVGMLTENPALMQLESGSRVKAWDQYLPRDEANAAARWAAVQKVAGDPTELAALESARTMATRPARSAALTMARIKGGGFFGPLEKAAQDVLSDPGSTQAEGAAANLVLSRISDKLKNASDDPAALYAIRKDITEGIKSLKPEEQASLRAANRVRMAFVNKIDETLDEASNGTWSKYLDTYKDKSGAITSMRAGQAIEQAFSKNTEAGAIPVGMGLKPAPQTLARQVNIHGQKQFGSTWKDRLLPEDREVLDIVARDLRKQQNVLQAPNRINSQTASYLDAGEVAGNIGESLISAGAAMTGVPGAAGAAGALTGAARQATKNRSEIALARLMQDPQALSDLILEARKAEKILGATTEPSRVARGIGDPYK